MRISLPGLIACSMAICTAPLFAATITETKLTAADGAAFDYFGISAAISGNTAIVGAYADDDKGNQSGSAYLFDTTTGAQIAKLTASDGAERDHFGQSVAISGNTAIVGAHRDDAKGYLSGSAYLFDTTTGTQIAKLTASDGAAYASFGHSVAIEGNTAIVGASNDDAHGTSSGSAYLFDTTTGTQIAKLTATDGAAYDYFGNSVAISGNTAIVGAYGDGENGAYSGSAYLFDVTTGTQIAKLTPDDGLANDLFGSSVAISGNTAIVGAFGSDDNGNESGSAYLFDITTGHQIAKLTAPDGAPTDFFGRSVAISGDTAIIGAYGDDTDVSGSGSAYLFDVTNGTQIAKLTASDRAVSDDFGWAVDLSGNTVIVGAYGDDSDVYNSGSVYLYDMGGEVAPVPLPAGIWLLGSAIGLCAMTRRRVRA